MREGQITVVKARIIEEKEQKHFPIREHRIRMKLKANLEVDLDQMQLQETKEHWLKT